MTADGGALARQLLASVVSLFTVPGSTAGISNVTTYYVNATAEQAEAIGNGTLDAARLVTAETPFTTASVETLSSLNSARRRMLVQVLQQDQAAGRQLTWQSADGVIIIIPVLSVHVRLLLPRAYMAAAARSAGGSGGSVSGSSGSGSGSGSAGIGGAAAAAAAAKTAADLLLTDPASMSRAIGAIAASWTAATGVPVKTTAVAALMQSQGRVLIVPPDEVLVLEEDLALAAAAAAAAEAASSSGGASVGMQPGTIAVVVIWCVLVAGALFGIVHFTRAKASPPHGKQSQTQSQRVSAAASGVANWGHTGAVPAAAPGADAVAASAATAALQAGASDAALQWRENPSHRAAAVAAALGARAGAGLAQRPETAPQLQQLERGHAFISPEAGAGAYTDSDASLDRAALRASVLRAVPPLPALPSLPATHAALLQVTTFGPSPFVTPRRDEVILAPAPAAAMDAASPTLDTAPAAAAISSPSLSAPASSVISPLEWVRTSQASLPSPSARTPAMASRRPPLDSTYLAQRRVPGGGAPPPPPLRLSTASNVRPPAARSLGSPTLGQQAAGIPGRRASGSDISGLPSDGSGGIASAGKASTFFASSSGRRLSM